MEIGQFDLISLCGLRPQTSKLKVCVALFPFFLQNEETSGFVSLPMSLLQVWPLPYSSYLTVLHCFTEEMIQQQVLQVSVSVESFFDFPEEDAGEEMKRSDAFQYRLSSR